MMHGSTCPSAGLAQCGVGAKGTRQELPMTDLLTPFSMIALQDAPPLPGETPVVAPGAVGQPTGAADGAARPAADPLGGMWIVIPFVLILVVFTMFGQRRERKKRAALMESIKRHDEVQTIGGIIGSVVELKDDTVILKIDENSNVRMTVAKSAIAQVRTGNTQGAAS
ncbi:MAG: preprotein translocase subunit YajC [Planctomycetes bacterium]|nr:preprotein translocase subunit YajC [Planctomycetota bacterium]